jgi:hypothetical protein
MGVALQLRNLTVHCYFHSKSTVPKTTVPYENSLEAQKNRCPKVRRMYTIIWHRQMGGLNVKVVEIGGRSEDGGRNI